MRASVIIPTYNMAATVGRAVTSALEQTYSDLEVIVVDDGSTDNTQEVVDAITDDRVRYVFQPNRGQPTALNVGVQNSTGHFVSFLDADDALPDNSIERRAVYLAIHRGKQAVFGSTRYVDAPSGSAVVRETKQGTGMELADQFINGLTIPFYAPSLMVRRAAFDALGGFDETFVRSHDVDFAVRLLTQMFVGRITDVTHNYTVGAKTLTQRVKYRLRTAYEKLRIAHKHRSLIPPSYGRVLAKELVKLCYEMATPSLAIAHRILARKKREVPYEGSTERV